MKKLYLLFFFYFYLHQFQAGAWAQNPGYRGKRLSLGYSFSFSSAFFNSSQNGTSVFKTGGSASQAYLSFNRMHTITADYAIGRKLSFGIYYLFMNTRYDGKHEVYYDNYSARPANYYTIKVNAIGVSMKLFRHGYIAPVGKYFKVDLLIKSISSSYDPKLFYLRTHEYIGNQEILRSNFGATKQTYLKPELFCSFGKQRIYFNRVIFDFGIRASSNVLLLPFMGIINENQRFDENVYIRTTSINRVRYANMINYYAGLSFLL